MNPLDRIKPDPVYYEVIKCLINFRQRELEVGMSQIDLHKHAQKEAKEIMQLMYDHFEEFVNKRSATTKYDLLKWLATKKDDTQYYR